MDYLYADEENEEISAILLGAKGMPDDEKILLSVFPMKYFEEKDMNDFFSLRQKDRIAVSNQIEDYWGGKVHTGSNFRILVEEYIKELYGEGIEEIAEHVFYKFYGNIKNPNEKKEKLNDLRKQLKRSMDTAKPEKGTMDLYEFICDYYFLSPEIITKGKGYRYELKKELNDKLLEQKNKFGNRKALQIYENKNMPMSEFKTKLCECLKKEKLSEDEIFNLIPVIIAIRDIGALQRTRKGEPTADKKRLDRLVKDLKE